mmetsp:Transcript_10265/g.19866  ORF Transcript_10265/g.19866 Transcript_10265/m.19866 type:complete len:345 (+) Transcript_10265:174-1208(+)
MPSMKSSCLISAAARRRASMPASTHTALSCAPLKSSQLRPSSSKFTSSLSTFIFREWICRMRARASSVGCGNSILRSSRPLRSRAGSSTSGRFVAAITLILSLLWKPSSWLSSSSIVRCTSRSPDCSPPNRLVPIASSSSMKMIAPFAPCSCTFSLASSKASRTSLAPSPMNICTSCGPASFRKIASVCLAHARASIVFPVPGGPCRSTPFGGRMPMVSNISLCVMGSTTASISSWICLSSPPMSEYSSVGFSSTSMALTRESYSAGSFSRMRYESLFVPTSSPGFSSSVGTSPGMGRKMVCRVEVLITAETPLRPASTSAAAPSSSSSSSGSISNISTTFPTR